MGQFAKAPFESERRTIDISGDGTNNAGRDVTLARDEALAQGITINGLVILSETPLALESGPHQSGGRSRQILPQPTSSAAPAPSSSSRRTSRRSAGPSSKS